MKKASPPQATPAATPDTAAFDANKWEREFKAKADAEERARRLKEMEPFTAATKLAPETALAWLKAGAMFSWHERTNSSYPRRPEHVPPPGGRVLRISQSYSGRIQGMDKLPAPEEPFVYGFDSREDTGRTLKELARFPNVVGLVADFEAFRPAVVEALPKFPAVRLLNFSLANVTDAHAPAIAVCKNLEHLNLESSKLTDRGVAQLAGLTKLKSLGLFAAPHTGKCLTALAGMADLEWLSIQGDNLTAAEAAPLAKLTKLRTLESHWALGDAGLSAVKDLPDLRQVTVSPSATVACLDTLKQMKKLEVIDCQQVTPALVAKVRAALPQCKVIADK